MDNVYTFTVYENPLSQPRPRLYRHIIISNTKKILEYKAAIVNVAKEVCTVPFTNQCVVKIIFYRKTHGRIDIDNLIKPVLDALNGIAYLDDRLVIALHAFKKFDKENPRFEIEITELPFQ